MLFRIEDIEASDGHLRRYEIPFENLPRLKMPELECYLAEEIRKEVNNANDRKLLSYSKSLGVCLLKYNKYTDNPLHINVNNMPNYVEYYKNNSNMEHEFVPFDLHYGLNCLAKDHSGCEIILKNFQVDVADNNLLNQYLKMATGTGRKKLASPEKDKEVLLMQSPDDIIIFEYKASVYLLYALVLKYGMNESVYINLMRKINKLEPYRFDFCGETERCGLIQIIEYLYHNVEAERIMSREVLQDSAKSGHLSTYYDPILELHGILEDDIEDSYMLSDYNSNVVSECIWRSYLQDK